MGTTIGERVKELNEQHQEAAKTGDRDELAAIGAQYGDLLNQAPEDSNLIFLVATIQLQLGFNGTAIQLLKRAISYEPKRPEYWNNLGSAWRAENRMKEARVCFQRALALREDADYLNNLCTLHVNEGTPEKGVKYADRAIDLKGDQYQAHWNRGLCLLEMGQWKQGFEEYEYGLLSGDRPLRQYSNNPMEVPFWEGQPDKTVVVYGEQGVGDEIMFASCIPDLIDVSKEVIYDCHPRMLALMERSFGITCYPTRKKDNIEWPKDHTLDHKCAAGSLFRHFRSEGQFPQKPYLKADPKRVMEYREWFMHLGPPPYIGIAWQGGAKKTRIDLRSFKLGHLGPILEQDATFVSLQYTDVEEKVKRYNADHPDHKLYHFPEVVKAFDYDETAALVEALDLVIAPNTTVVHLAGALGKECWTLTPAAPAWRYGLEGDKMPFYESVTQIRQKKGEKWVDEIPKVADRLKQWLAV